MLQEEMAMGPAPPSPRGSTDMTGATESMQAAVMVSQRYKLCLLLCNLHVLVRKKLAKSDFSFVNSYAQPRSRLSRLFSAATVAGGSERGTTPAPSS